MDDLGEAQHVEVGNDRPAPIRIDISNTGLDPSTTTTTTTSKLGHQYKTSISSPANPPTEVKPVIHATLGLAKAAVGAGALLFPSCYHRLGLIPGLLVTLLSAFVSLVTLSFLGDACRATNASDFQSVAKRAGGHRAWSIVAAVGQFALLFGPLLVYLSIIGEYTADLAQLVLLGLRIPPALCQFVLGVAVILPLTLRANTPLLNRLGVLGMLGMCYVAALCVFDAVFFRHTPPIGSASVFKPNVSYFVGGTSLRDAFAAIPMIVFSFSSHLAFPLLLQDMPSTAFAMQTIVGSVAATSGIYVVIGVFGYERFGDMVHGRDVLKVGYGHGHLPSLYLLAEVVVAMANVVSCPILLLSLVALIKTAMQRDSAGEQLPLANAKILAGKEAYMTEERITMTVLLLAVVIVPFAGSIGGILDVLGALFGTPMALLLPSWFYLRACQPKTAWKRHVAHGCIFLGAFLPVIAFL